MQHQGLIAAISEGISLSDVLGYNFVDIDTGQELSLLNNENVKKSPSIVAALLRKAWFDTTRFVK